MKFFEVFIDIFCVFALLTMGSLLTVVAFHILPMEDALIQVQAIYESGAQSFQLGLTGGLFIISGLMLSKFLLKKTRKDDDFFIVESETGRLSVTYHAINNLVERVSKRFEEIRFRKASSSYERGELKIHLEAEVVKGVELAGLSGRIRQEAEERVAKLLGKSMAVSFTIHVVKIIEGIKV